MALKDDIRKIAGKIAGVNKLQEQVDAAFYFLNQYCDITKAPKATGALRDLQECDTVLLAIVDKLCRKHSLTYWLEAGTLLGAVRHGGFIPWDDDIDVFMPRDSFDRAKTVLCEELKSYGIDAEEDILMSRIGIGYKHKQTGIWVDVFSVDYCNMDMQNHANRVALKNQINRYRKHLSRTDEKKNLERKSRILPSLSTKENAVSVLFSPESTADLRAWNMETVFPLREIPFEDFFFYAPLDEHHLTEFYGPNYMSFPQTGLMHHGDASGGLASWAKNSGTDMADIKKELGAILNNLGN